MSKLLIDTGIVEFLFDKNPIVVFLCGLAADIVLSVIFSFIFNRDGNGRKGKIIATGLILLVIVIAVTALTYHVGEKYTRVPNSFEEENLPYSQAALILRQECGLRCSDKFDTVAEKALSEGEDLASHHFYITDCDPKPGTLVEKNSEVVLHVSWKPRMIGDVTEISKTNDGKEPISTITLKSEDEVEPYTYTEPTLPTSYPSVTSEMAPITDETQNTPLPPSRAEYENPYPEDVEYIPSPFNAKEFILTVRELALRIETEENEKWALGSVPDTLLPMQIDLIDFDKNTIVDSKSAYLGDSVHFGDIPDGTYYTRISCAGYETEIDESPFTLQYDGSKEKSILRWITYLEKKGSNFGEPFRVRMLTTGNGIAPYTETTISVIDNNGRWYSSYPVYINEDGYLTLWMAINHIDYYFTANFCVADGYTLVVYNRNNVPVEARNIVNGICELVY